MKLKRLLKNSFIFENGLKIGLNNEMIKKFDLTRREELSQDEYLAVLALSALSTAYYYLSKRDYSKKELYTKLIQKYWEKIPVNTVIEKLESNGYINDLEFTISYIKNRNVSRKKIEYDLILKGISRDIIQEALLNYNKEDEIEGLLKEWNKLKNKEESKKIASLMRKGYSYGDIKKIIEMKKVGEC